MAIPHRRSTSDPPEFPLTPITPSQGLIDLPRGSEGPEHTCSATSPSSAPAPPPDIAVVPSARPPRSIRASVSPHVLPWSFCVSFYRPYPTSVAGTSFTGAPPPRLRNPAVAGTLQHLSTPHHPRFGLL
jgi:hypothetical protein